ncbi:hypothetical protein GCM10020229_72530 [Kitasatospora albolonga]|uniref:hypothetical protein n=1 Tax=Kitasatospora albolonga TaxID=68173 RepID=UPI0031EDCBBB
MAPEAVIATEEEWADHVEETEHVLEASLDDLDWADVIPFGTPTRLEDISFGWVE